MALRSSILAAFVAVAAPLATGCVVVDNTNPNPPGPSCTQGVTEGQFLSYPVRRNRTLSFPTAEYGYALTVGGQSAAAADQWKLTFLDSTGVTTRQFSGYISSGNGFTVYSPFGGANAMPDAQDPGRFLVYGGLGSTNPAGVDFDALSFPIALQAAVNQSYNDGRIYYVDGQTLDVCFVDGGRAAFYPYP